MLSIINSPEDPDSDQDSTGCMPPPLTTEARALLIDALLAQARDDQTERDRPDSERPAPKRRKEEDA